MFTLLRKRSFALLWFGGLISLMGDRALLVALPFYVYQQSHSTMVTAILVATRLVPHLIFGSIAGVMVDRMDRKKIMVITSLIQGLVLLPLLWVHSADLLWVVFLVSFLQTTFTAFFSPAETALLPTLVNDADLLPANAMNAMNNHIARLIGPVIGGAILFAFGLPGIILVDFLSFVIAAGMIAVIRLPARQAPAQPAPRQAVSEARHKEKSSIAQFVEEWREGVSFLRKDTVITMLLMTVVLINFGGVMIDPLSAPFITDVVRANSQIFGYLTTAQALGGIAGGLVTARLGQRISPARIYGWGTIVVGVFQLVKYNLPTLQVVFLTSIAIGLPAAMLAAALDTLFQQLVPNSHLGRIAGIMDTVISMVSVIGVLGISGALGERLGIVTVLNFAAMVTISAGVLALLLLPAGQAKAAIVLHEEAEA